MFNESRILFNGTTEWNQTCAIWAKSPIVKQAFVLNQLRAWFKQLGTAGVERESIEESVMDGTSVYLIDMDSAFQEEIKSMKRVPYSQGSWCHYRGSVIKTLLQVSELAERKKCSQPDGHATLQRLMAEFDSALESDKPLYPQASLKHESASEGWNKRQSTASSDYPLGAGIAQCSTRGSLPDSASIGDSVRKDWGSGAPTQASEGLMLFMDHYLTAEPHIFMDNVTISAQSVSPQISTAI